MFCVFSLYERQKYKKCGKVYLFPREKRPGVVRAVKFRIFVQNSTAVKTVELLAPAKDYVSAVTAIEAGADAVYIGGARFGARQAAGNSAAEIARVVEYAHRFGVRVHATLNTLLWDNELREAERTARELIDAGIDALIVQDMALRRMNLPVELHASTQVSNRTPEGARFLAEAGFARVILERALSLDEIRAICTATPAEVEVFVHGAICVGYSGRCFLSRAMSGRSGNRGACSQPCRLPWDLVDGRGRKIISGKHLLSVRDMNLSHRLGELVDAGVTSFKIEGRLKDAGYIRNVVAWYRRALDEVLAVRPALRRASVGESIPDFEPDPAKSFTRGESEYFFDGKRAGVASFDTPKAVGERIGRVTQVSGGNFRIDVDADLAPGDGICLITPRGVVGTNINAVEGRRITPNRIEGITPGAELYRNYDRRFSLALERSRMRRVIPTRALVEAAADGVTLTCTDCEGVEATVRRDGPLERAKNPEANAATLRTQAAKSGDTIFAVREVEVRGGEWFVPASLAAELRREVLEELLRRRTERPLSHRILPENPEARYPSQRLGAEDNVTNRLAEAFYRDHGVREIESSLELASSLEGRTVMRSAYCIRREIGECLREGSRLGGDLYLEHGGDRFRLMFDCAACEMALVDCPRRRTDKEKKR